MAFALATALSAPGTMDEAGLSHLPKDMMFPFETPLGRPGYPHRMGTNKDIGSLVLFLVANWFVDGETVLIDGGVSDLVSVDGEKLSLRS